MTKGQRLLEGLIHGALLLCASVSVLTTAGIVVVLFTESFPFFSQVSLVEFLTSTEWSPLFINKNYGILPLLSGTLLTSAIALSISVPTGVIIAIYMSEFASEKGRRVLKPILEILAGIPSVVFGYFALLAVTPVLQYLIPELPTFNALGPGIVMGLMILPMVASLCEDALYAVPQSLREGAYALGASKLQMIFGVLLRAGFGGIVAAFILALSRAIGETMVVAIAAGQQPIFTFNPTEGVQTMTAYIVQISLGDTPHGTLEYTTIFAVGLTLFLMTFLLNSLSVVVRERFQRKAA